MYILGPPNAGSTAAIPTSMSLQKIKECAASTSAGAPSDQGSITLNQLDIKHRSYTRPLSPNAQANAESHPNAAYLGDFNDEMVLLEGGAMRVSTQFWSIVPCIDVC